METPKVTESDLYKMLGQRDVEIYRLCIENNLLRSTIAAKNSMLTKLETKEKSSESREET